MGKKNTYQIVTWILVILLCLSLLGWSNYTKTVEVEKVVEVPGECEACEVCEEITIVDEVEPTYRDYLEEAKTEAFKEILDDYAYGYDDDEINWYGSVDEYAISFDEDGYTISFIAEVKYKDGLEKETAEFEFEVSWDIDDEEFDVEVSEL